MASRIKRKGARRLMPIIASHAASLVFSIVPVAITPAAFTSTSMPPKLSTAFLTMPDGDCSSVTSAAKAMDRPPAEEISRDTSARAAGSLETSATAAPSRAKASAAARPMPLDAPVTMTTLCRNDIGRLV
jgi:hypothetical protein